jgi:heat shock protein HslJ
MSKSITMKLTTFISTGAFILFAAFLMKKENIPTQSLYGTKWLLKKIHNEEGVEDVQTKAFIKFNQEKKSAGGNGSCNTFGSQAVINNKEINFTNIFSTKMYCEGVQKTEDAFFKQLAKANRFEVKDSILLLYQVNDVLLEFSAE